MMKKLAALIFGSVLMTGCATTQNVENVSTVGLLICKPNELCPIVTVSWNESHKDLLKLRVSLNSTKTQYDIQKVIFDNGQQSYSFSPVGKTEQDFVFGNYRSRNSIITPVNLMNNLRGSDQILMNIYTDKGVISRYVYKDGQEALIYKEFKSVYK